MGFFVVFCPNASFVCVLTWECSRGRSEKQNDTKGKGVRAQQGGQKVEQGVREMVVLRGCCTMTVVSCNV